MCIRDRFTPDLATPISEMAKKAEQNNWPTKVEVGLIGSCTNSSYEDISRSASIAQQAVENGLVTKSKFTITPGSEQVRYTIERDGFIDIFNDLGGSVFANACGPCIGQWSRKGAEKEDKNTIVHSFNRNFAKRADGNPNTHAFVGSPELVTAIAIAGDLTFNPIKDTLVNNDGGIVKFQEPSGSELPDKGFDVKDNGYQAPAKDGKDIEVIINPRSERLQFLEPFKEWNGKSIFGVKLLIKAKGKCTTDHISMAGPWLRLRGHLDNISNNMLTGAVNFFNDETNLVKNQLSGNYGPVPEVQRDYKFNQVLSLVVGDENYGEGSSREHAAMEPRFRGCRVVLVKSFARIHEANLKKQGILPLTFADKVDYEKIEQNDKLTIKDLENLCPGSKVTVSIHKEDGSRLDIDTNHSLSCLLYTSPSPRDGLLSRMPSSA